MFSLHVKRDAVQQVVNNTRTWLASHGHGSKKPWPQHEIDTKTQRLAVLKEVVKDYEQRIERTSI